jgi:hypothetical protein
LHWPFTQDWRECAECGKPTVPDSFGTAMCMGEAVSRKLHAAFEREYAEREKRREREGRPTPEALGRLDAQRQIAEARELEARLLR